MGNGPEQRIWRYMDISKFISLLTTRSLYFACPSELGDPYEGFLPKSQVSPWSDVTQRLVDDMLSLRPHFAAKSTKTSDTVTDTDPSRLWHSGRGWAQSGPGIISAPSRLILLSNCVIPKPRVFTSGARDPACSIPPSARPQPRTPNVHSSQTK